VAVIYGLFFGLFVIWGHPDVFKYRPFFPTLAGWTTGSALTVYITSGLIPMIFWGFRQFRAEKAALPFIRQRSIERKPHVASGHR
jgi:hypothetical protein